MKRAALIVGAVGLLVIAAIVHAYHIDYRTAIDGHIFSFGELDRASSDRVRSEMRNRLAAQPGIDRLRKHDPLGWQALERKHMLARGGLAASAAALAADEMGGDVDRMKQAEIDAHEASEAVTRIENEITAKIRALNRRQLNKIDDTNVPFGLLPSKNIGGSPRLARRDAFWIGIVLPMVLAIGSMLLLMLARNATGRNGQNRTSPPGLGMTDRRRPTEEVTVDEDSPVNGGVEPIPVKLAEAVRDHLGDDFPAPSGNGSAKDPLVISATEGYVRHEYEAARVAMRLLGLDYKSEGNKLHSRDGQYIDELIFSVKPAGAAEWTGKRSLFFDVTSGFNAL